jgi:hypothetical protein
VVDVVKPFSPKVKRWGGGAALMAVVLGGYVACRPNPAKIAAEQMIGPSAEKLYSLFDQDEIEELGLGPEGVLKLRNALLGEGLKISRFGCEKTPNGSDLSRTIKLELNNNGRTTYLELAGYANPLTKKYEFKQILQAWKIHWAMDGKPFVSRNDLYKALSDKGAKLQQIFIDSGATVYPRIGADPIPVHEIAAYTASSNKRYRLARGL